MDAGDEGAVDLEAVHGQVAHRGEAAPAGAEVVEEDPHPLDAQGAQDLVGGVRVADEGVLGDLDDEAVSGGPGPVQGVPNLVEEPGGDQLRGDVDGHGMTLALPVDGGDGSVEHQGRQRHHEPGMFDLPQELPGRDQGPVLPPTNQGLHGQQGAVVDPDDGLVMKLEGRPAILKVGAQAGAHAQPLDGTRSLLATVGADQSRPLALGMVHGQIRLLEQGTDGGQGVEGGADPHAGGEGHGHAVDLEGLLQGCPQPLGAGEGLAGIGEAHEHGELVPLQAGEDVPRAQAAPQALGGQGQQAVPALMAQTGIDVGEAVQAQGDEAPAGGGGEGLAREFRQGVEGMAVGQAGEVVDECPAALLVGLRRVADGVIQAEQRQGQGGDGRVTGKITEGAFGAPTQGQSREHHRDGRWHHPSQRLDLRGRQGLQAKDGGPGQGQTAEQPADIHPGALDVGIIGREDPIEAVRQGEDQIAQGDEPPPWGDSPALDVGQEQGQDHEDEITGDVETGDHQSLLRRGGTGPPSLQEDGQGHQQAAAQDQGIQQVTVTSGGLAHQQPQGQDLHRVVG